MGKDPTRLTFAQQRRALRRAEVAPGHAEVSRRMRQALARAGLTQAEAARLADVGRDVVHKAIQRGSVPRTAEERDAVAKTLSTTSPVLWFGMGEEAAPFAAM